MKYIRRLIAVASVFFVMGVFQPEAEASQLKMGSKGADVTYIQSILKKLGYFYGNTTGYYGPITRNAVEQFQRDFGIEAVGEVGPKTSRMINDVEMMAHTVHGEARGENYRGQVAVAAVILNRVQSSDFPDSIHGVIFQRNAFTAVADGQYYLHPGTTAYKAVKDAFLGWDPSHGAVYYYNPRLATDEWIFSREVNEQIGAHNFAH